MIVTSRMFAVLLFLAGAVLSMPSSYEYALTSIDATTGESSCLQFHAVSGEPTFGPCVDLASALTLESDPGPGKLTRVSTGECIVRDSITGLPKVGPCENSLWKASFGVLWDAASATCPAASTDLILTMKSTGCDEIDRLYWLPHRGLERAGLLDLEIRDFLGAQCSVMLRQTFGENVDETDLPSCEELISRDVPADLPGAELLAIKDLIDFFSNEPSTGRKLIAPALPALGYTAITAVRFARPLLAPAKRGFRTALTKADGFLKKPRFGGITAGELAKDGILYGLGTWFSNEDQVETTNIMLDYNVQNRLSIQNTNIMVNTYESTVSTQDLMTSFEVGLNSASVEVNANIDSLKQSVRIQQETTMKGLQGLKEGQTKLGEELSAVGVALAWFRDDAEARNAREAVESRNQEQREKLQMQLQRVAQIGQALQSVAGFLGADEDVQQVIGAGINLVVALIPPPKDPFTLATSLLGFAGSLFGGGGISSDELARLRHEQIMKALEELLIEVRQGFELVEERLDDIERLAHYIIDSANDFYKDFERNMETQRQDVLSLSTLTVALAEDDLYGELGELEVNYVLGNLDTDLLEAPPSAVEFRRELSKIISSVSLPEYTAVTSILIDPWDPTGASYKIAKDALLGVAMAERNSPAANDIITSPLHVLLSPSSGLAISFQEYGRTAWMRRVWLVIALIQRFPNLYMDFQRTRPDEVHDRLLEPLNKLRAMDISGRSAGLPNAWAEYEEKVDAFSVHWAQEVSNFLSNRAASFPAEEWKLHDFFEVRYDRDNNIMVHDGENPLLGPDGESLPDTDYLLSDNEAEKLRELLVAPIDNRPVLDPQAIILAQKFGLEFRDFSGPKHYGWGTTYVVVFVAERPCMPLYAYNKQYNLYNRDALTLLWVTDFSWETADQPTAEGMFAGRHVKFRGNSISSAESASLWDLLPISSGDWEGCTGPDQYAEGHRQAAANVLQYQAQYPASISRVEASPDIGVLWDKSPGRHFEIAELMLMTGLPREFFPSHRFSEDQTIANKIIRRTTLDLARAALDRMKGELLFISLEENIPTVAENIEYSFDVFHEAISFQETMDELLRESQRNAMAMKTALEAHAVRLVDWNLDEVPYVTAAEIELDLTIQCALSGAVDCRPGKARHEAPALTEFPTDTPSGVPPTQFPTDTPSSVTWTVPTITPTVVASEECSFIQDTLMQIVFGWLFGIFGIVFCDQ